MAALIVSQRAPACVQQLSLSTAPFPTAMAPGLGLLLDETIFESYNTRYDKEKEAHEGTAHVRLSLDAISDAVQQFKRARIYPHIAQTELQDRPFRTFLEREDEQPTDWAGLISASEKHTHAAAVSALLPSRLAPPCRAGTRVGGRSATLSVSSPAAASGRRTKRGKCGGKGARAEGKRP